MWDLIVSVPDHCLSFYFSKRFSLEVATNDKIFLLTSKFCSQGVVSPCPGAIYMYKIMKKNCIKSDFKEIFLKLVANDQNDKPFLLA